MRVRLRPTPRAVGSIVVGAALGVLGASMRSATLAAIGALLVVTPLVMIAWTLLALRWASSVSRTLTPNHFRVGTDTVVALRHGRTSPPWSRTTDRVPATLRRRPGGGGYVVHPTARGAYAIGPVVRHQEDPLAMASARAVIRPADAILVWPAAEPLDPTVLRSGLEREAAARIGTPQRSLDDATLREYRRGDPMDRVHWRATARRGTLMVRQDEPTRDRRVDLWLDPGPDEGPDLERAVRAAVTVLEECRRSGLPTRLLLPTADGTETLEVDRLEPALDRLAVVGPVPGPLHDLPEAPSALVAVLGSGAPDRLAPLLRAGAGRGTLAYPSEGAHAAVRTTLGAAGWGVVAP